MKQIYLVFFVLFLYVNLLFSQNTNGVKSFDIPAKSTLKFNKFLINPAFSFVREDIPTLSIFNKTQWAGFDNSPSSYLLNYSGKFQENNALSAAAFFQNYGILTTTGGLLNYSRNVMFEEEINLTFGLNIGVYKSGINSSKIITNTIDPLLNGFNNNTILVINPGINYGIDLLDFGVSANNLVLYNLSNSKAVVSDPEKSFQLHAMYTGFIVSNGYFDESKFTTLLRVENKKVKTEFSGNFMFEKPSLGWIQAGYNNVYGISGGLGFNINKNISLGYNFEKGLGVITDLGNSHEFVLAYVFNEWEERTDGTGPTYTKTVSQSPKIDPALEAAEKLRLANERIEKEKAIADAKFKAFAAAKARAAELAKNKELEDAAKFKANQEAKVKADADAKIRAELSALSSAERAKANALAKIKAEADAKVKALADRAKAISEANERAKQAIIDAKEAAAEKVAAEKAAKANFVAQRLANAKAIAEAKVKAEAEAKENAKNKAENAKNQALLNAKQKADELERIRIATEKQKAEAARLNKIKADDDAKANAENIAKAKLITDSAKDEADRIAKQKAEAAAIAKAESDKLKSVAAKLAAEKLAEIIKPNLMLLLLQNLKPQI